MVVWQGGRAGGVAGAFHVAVAVAVRGKARVVVAAEIEESKQGVPLPICSLPD